MMTADEWATFQALPDRLTLYRGAGRGVNERGLSWTTDQKVAERFSYLNRYRAEHPVLVTGTIQKSRVVAFKDERQESEIIAPRHVRITSVEALPEQPPAEQGRG